jgi:hypothetical protein
LPPNALPIPLDPPVISACIWALIAPPCHSFAADTIIDGHLILRERWQRRP